jgi:DeoR/GlpR family transcriptional regulator of sugar metabolism
LTSIIKYSILVLVKVPLHIVKARQDRLADLLQRNRFLSLAELCRKLNVSEATARRDLAALEREKVLTRTWGGAWMDSNQRFPSFRQRQFGARSAKRQIASRALQELKPGMLVFFDAGTTVYAIAEALAIHPVDQLAVVTNSLPVAEILAEVKCMEVSLVAGSYLARQSMLLGEPARRSLRLWKFDLAFSSAEGMTKDGIWNSHADVVQFQKEMMKLASRSIFCIDATKLGIRAPQFLLPWTRVGNLLTDASSRQLKNAGIKFGRTKLLSTGCSTAETTFMKRAS